MSSVPGTNVAAPVVPFTTDDQYPTHDSQYGKGGWREVSSTAERDAIPAGRTRDGMVVYVVGDGAYIRLAGSWQPYSPSDLTSFLAAVRKAAFLE
ncbi:hypothetical protein GC176_20510 [bacterium]|nr:hypothetical protein [bacterium]